MEIPLSKLQQEIIIGNILGDGCVEFDGFRGSRLQIKQAEKYEDYVFWLYRELKDLCKSTPKRKRDTNQWYFSTRHLDKLTELYKLFYPNGKKKIPKNITDLIVSDLTLAVWYMDDGRLDYRPKDHYTFMLSTDDFSFEDVHRLKEVLSDNFGIVSTVYSCLGKSKRYPKLYIGAIGRDKFLKLISPHILTCFSHKLPPLNIKRNYNLTPQRLISPDGE